MVYLIKHFIENYMDMKIRLFLWKIVQVTSLEDIVEKNGKYLMDTLAPVKTLSLNITPIFAAIIG